jgi:hypothetical protein
VELPTYTNIWRIEKRLYKLYDFRLPMPLPVGQMMVFLAIAVPYTVLLTLVGVPFSHTLVWLYLLPPAGLAWLATRPVLEGKRLPELVLSQLRYLSEPRVWCRLAPLAEADEITVTGKVWRRASQPVRQRAEPAESARQEPALGQAASQVPIAERMSRSAVKKPPARPAVQPAAAKPRVRAAGPAKAQVKPAAAVQPRVQAAAVQPRAQVSPARPQAQQSPARPSPQPSRARPQVQQAASEQRLPVVERALRGHPGQRNGWGGHAVLVPGGHRPGQPDQLQRDQARARLDLTGPARVVVIGCTAGAGQTMTTLITGQLLAQLRNEAVAVLDLNPGAESLTERALAVTRLLPGPSAKPESGLQVITAEPAADGTGPKDAGPKNTGQQNTAPDASLLIDAVAGRYPLLLADPAAASVPRALESADQLVLVTPASPEGPNALAMTMEWLDTSGHGRLAADSIVVVNGLSSQSVRHGEQAASVAKGRCLAIVNVPWDGAAAWDVQACGKPGGQLGQGAVLAFTALAGVLVTGLARQPESVST